MTTATPSGRRGRARLAQHAGHATSRLVGVIGVDDVTVVETADAVLVAHRSKSPE
jgi:hypothetical protein